MRETGPAHSARASNWRTAAAKARQGHVVGTISPKTGLICATGCENSPSRPSKRLTWLLSCTRSADPSRLRSVASLADAPGLTTCTELADLAASEGLAKSTWSHHLRVLREAGVIRTRHDGTRKFVSLRRADLDSRFPGLLEAVLEGVHADFAKD